MTQDPREAIFAGIIIGRTGALIIEAINEHKRQGVMMNYRPAEIESMINHERDRLAREVPEHAEEIMSIKVGQREQFRGVALTWGTTP